MSLSDIFCIFGLYLVIVPRILAWRDGVKTYDEFQVWLYMQPIENQKMIFFAVMSGLFFFFFSFALSNSPIVEIW